MAEIGLVASIVNIAGAGAQLSLTLYRIAETVGSAGFEAQIIAAETSLLSQSLTQLSKTLNGRTNDNELHGIVRGVMKQCRSVLRELRRLTKEIVPAKSQSHQPSNPGFMARLRWLLRRPKVLFLRTCICSFSTNLNLLVTSLDYKDAVERNLPEELTVPLHTQAETMWRTATHSKDQMENCANGSHAAVRSKALLSSTVHLDTDGDDPSQLAANRELHRNDDHVLEQHDMAPSSAMSRTSDCLINVQKNIDVQEKVLSLSSSMIHEENPRNRHPPLQDLLTNLDDHEDPSVEDESTAFRTSSSKKPANEKSQNKPKDIPDNTRHRAYGRLDGRNRHKESNHDDQPHNDLIDDAVDTVMDDVMAGPAEDKATRVSTNVSEHITSPTTPGDLQAVLLALLRQTLDGQQGGSTPGGAKVAEVTALQPQGAAKQVNTAPTTDPRATIRFKDAVGRKFSFPYSLSKTWKGMESLIKQAFLHVDVLGEHVHQGHYDLMGPDGEIILPQVWETMVQPDWEISMHMWPMPEDEPISKNKNKLAEDAMGLMDPFAAMGLGGLGDLGIVDPGRKKRKKPGSKKKTSDPIIDASGILPPPPPFAPGMLSDPLDMAGMFPPGISPVAEDKKDKRTVSASSRAKDRTKSSNGLAGWFAGSANLEKPKP